MLTSVQNGELSGVTIELEVQPVGLVRIDKHIFVGCMDGCIHAYQLRVCWLHHHAVSKGAHNCAAELSILSLCACYTKCPPNCVIGEERLYAIYASWYNKHGVATSSNYKCKGNTGCCAYCGGVFANRSGTLNITSGIELCGHEYGHIVVPQLSLRDRSRLLLCWDWLFSLGTSCGTRNRRAARLSRKESNIIYYYRWRVDGFVFNSVASDKLTSFMSLYFATRGSAKPQGPVRFLVDGIALVLWQTLTNGVL